MSETTDTYTATFSIMDLIVKVRELAAERPDFVYERPGGVLSSCLYVHEAEDQERTAGCIMGQALHALGMPLAALKQYEHKGVQGILRGVANYPGIYPAEYVRRWDGAAQWLSDVQYKQDQRSPWAECIAYADELGWAVRAAAAE